MLISNRHAMAVSYICYIKQILIYEFPIQFSGKSEDKNVVKSRNNDVENRNPHNLSQCNTTQIQRNFININ